MRENVQKRPHRRVAVADAFHDEFGVMHRHHARNTDHSHKIDEHFQLLLFGKFVERILNS